MRLGRRRESVSVAGSGGACTSPDDEVLEDFAFGILMC